MVPNSKLQIIFIVFFLPFYPLDLIIKHSMNLKAFHILLCNYYDLVFNKLKTAEKIELYNVFFVINKPCLIYIIGIYFMRKINIERKPMQVYLENIHIHL